MNILYIGSSTVLSLIPFNQLLGASHNIVAVGIDKPVVFDNKVIALQNESLALAARQAEVPVIDMSMPVTDVVQHCEKLRVDLILMSCYRKRLASEVINLAVKGCYNMHPSLLPAYRGPEPIFWQMKKGSDMGVSWHRVVHDFDAGDIVVQKKVNLSDGLSHAEISTQLAVAGAAILTELLTQLTDSSLHPVRQNEAKASYFPYPQQSDFVIDTTNDAQQNYNFMCASQAFSYAFHYRYNHSSLYLTKAIDYENNQTLDTPEVQADRIYIPCNGGVLIAEYTDKMPD